MRFGSVCSGIEAASVAWEPLGWKAAWFSEIEPFPCAVLAHHYPSVPNLGDMTTLPNRILEGEVEAPDVFCGGTPCQAFSVAGKRQSLDDARGNLSLVFCEIANAIDDVRGVAGQQPTIVFWENVPGVLSTKDNAFGCFLGELAGEDCAIEPPRGKWTNAGCVYGPQRTVAWRVLDAQYFGVAQRRRRVFVVASARTDIDPAAILFEFDGLRRDIAPRREAGKEAAKCLTRGANQRYDYETEDFVTQPSVASSVSPTIKRDYGKGYGDGEMDGGGLVQHPTYSVCLGSDPIYAKELAQPITRRNGDPGTIAQSIPFGVGESPDTAHCLRSGASRADKHESTTYVAQPFQQTADCLTSAYGTKWNGNASATNGSLFVAQPVAMTAMRESGQGYWMQDDIAGTLRAEGENRPSRPSHVVGQAFQQSQSGVRVSDTSGTLRGSTAGGLHDNGVLTPAMAVRRLTPVECERLQGFPDNYTLIPWRKKPASECPDGPRYKALGNSWAVPNVRWIGHRIQLAVEIAGGAK